MFKVFANMNFLEGLLLDKTPRNWYNIFMSGNVSEWCHDYFDAYNSGSEKNPQWPLKGSDHVIRGGSWLTDEKKCRVISRDHKLPTCRDSSIGLRLLLNNLK